MIVGELVTGSISFTTRPLSKELNSTNQTYSQEKNSYAYSFNTVTFIFSEHYV